ncbi:MAG: response regulator [Alphaproteobacteria bacterium]|nr:response regulator [Alphaproteobacteria bacterium]
MPSIDQPNQDSTQQFDGPLVLVIEDNLSDGSFLERHLQRLGYRSEVIRGGAYGLSRARETRPAAIILDIELLGMDGYQVLETLKADTTLRSVPVIVSSANTEARARMLENGAREFLPKPVDRVALKTALCKYCEPENSTASDAV